MAWLKNTVKLTCGKLNKEPKIPTIDYIKLILRSCKM